MEAKTWRHLNFFQYRSLIHARLPRIQCKRDGVLQVEAPWARPGTGFTVLFEAFVLVLAKEMPVNAVARLLGEHDTPDLAAASWPSAYPLLQADPTAHGQRVPHGPETWSGQLLR